MYTIIPTVCFPLKIFAYVKIKENINKIIMKQKNLWYISRQLSIAPSAWAKRGCLTMHRWTDSLLRADFQKNYFKFNETADMWTRWCTGWCWRLTTRTWSATGFDLTVCSLHVFSVPCVRLSRSPLSRNEHVMGPGNWKLSSGVSVNECLPLHMGLQNLCRYSAGCHIVSHCPPPGNQTWAEH